MNYIELSKEISYALRHAPWEYELEINEEGWVQVEQLLDALHKDEKWKNKSVLWTFYSDKNCKRGKNATRGIVSWNC